MTYPNHNKCGGRLVATQRLGISKRTKKRSTISNKKYFICTKCEKIVELKITQRTLK